MWPLHILCGSNQHWQRLPLVHWGVHRSRDKRIRVHVEFFECGGAYHSTQLMINTAVWGLVHAHTSSTSVMQSTGVVVAHVNKGDDVHVKTSGLSSGILRSTTGKTLFAGWKLH